MTNEIELFKRQIAREREARKQAEFLLESKSKELYETNLLLQSLNANLEQLVDERTHQVEKEKEQLKHIIDQHPLPMLISVGKENRIINANKMAMELFKLDVNELTKKHVNDLVQSEIDADLEELNGNFYTIVNDVKHELRCHSSQIQTDDIPGKLILLEDISEKNEMLIAINRKERQYKNLVENSSDVIFICNSDGQFKYVNPTAIKLTGFEEEELIDSHFFKLVRDDYRKKLRGFYTFQVQNSVPSTYIEFPIICKDGKELWLGQTVDLNYNPDGNVEFLALSREISDRIKYEKAIMRSEEKFRSIIENLELGLLEVDRNGIILKAYPQFCRLTGYSPDELIGKDPLDILVDEDSRIKIINESQKRKKGNSSVYEIKMFKKDGTPIWVMISGAPYYNEKNEVAGTVGIHLDITDRKLMEEELKEAKLLAENSLRSKDLFVANISHEVRTPLNAIMGMSQLLGQSELDEKQQRFVQAISKSSENLLSIVNDLLDFSKLEAGKMELAIGTHNIYDTINEVANLWEFKIEEKNIVFDKQLKIPHDFYAYDAIRLNGILTNLLHNALKFTERGTITLCVEMVRETNYTANFLFKIEDTGIGISKAQQAQIFESFVQAEPGTARKYGGTGLGLSISRDLIELMGGQLKVTSELNSGTLFQFELCFEKRNEVPVISTEITQKLDLFNGLNILLVEDNNFNQMMAQSILEKWHINVTIANNGKEALELISKKEFDLILMDIQMPIMDGIETAWHIRYELKLTIPILALTANAMANDIKKYMDVGMDGFVLKPFRQQDLYDSIQNIFYPVVKEPQDLMQKATMEREPIYIDTICDLTNLTKNCMGDPIFIKKMIVIAIQEIENKTIKIEESLHSSEHIEIKRIAHSLKPTIINVAKTPTYELLQYIELEENNSQWEMHVTELIAHLTQLKIELQQHNE